MKVIYILPTGSGGLPHYTAELANAISEYAEVIVIKPEKSTADDIFLKNVRIINAFKPLTLSFVDMYEIRRLIRMLYPSNLAKIISYRNIDVINRIDPDIVHINGLFPQIQIFAHRIKRYPKVVTFHDVLHKRAKIRDLKTFFINSSMNIWDTLSSIFSKQKLTE